MTLALALMLGACDRGADDGPRPPAAEAEFRWHAREMYKSLLMPSCGAPRGFRRADLLRPEQAAVVAFEREASGTKLQSHLVLARSQVARALKRDGGCWSDEDMRFARLHVETTRSDVRNGLARMQALAGSVGAPAPGGLSIGRGADFQHRVRDLVRSSRARCPITIRGDNDRIMAPARAELARFRQRLAGTPYAGHFDMAQADVAFEDSINVVECANPSSSPAAQASREALTNVKRQIAALETSIRRG